MELNDAVDIGINAFRFSGFVVKSLFARVDSAPACDSQYEAGSWRFAPPSLEEVRIARYLSRQPLNGKAILHVGVGSSSIAKRFHERCRLIDGITVMADEAQEAEGLEIQNYRVYLMNKYTDQIAALPNRYDFIVDAAPSAFTSERSAFEAMVRRYVELLAPGGVWLTDRLGMHYHERYAFPVYDDDLLAFEQILPVKYARIDRGVRILQKLESRRAAESRRRIPAAVGAKAPS